MDVAWKLGTGSKADDWELRMSMRSFWTNYRSESNFWIIGHIPRWIDPQHIRCIPWPDPYTRCKDANLIHKALRLAMEPQISDPFLFCSDDQLLLRTSSAEDFKLWHRGEIPESYSGRRNKWMSRLVNTGIQLRNAGFSAMDFDCHVPYPLRKEWIREALRFNFSNKPGMCVHSTIINCCMELGELIKDKPILAWLGNADVSASVIDEKLLQYQFANLNGDSMKNDHTISAIQRLFPNPAPWELDGSSWKSF